MYIIVDPGHGGKDSGATYQHGNLSIIEKDINLRAGFYLQEALTNLGHTAVMTREFDIYETLDQRVQMEHNLSPHLFISLHCNYYHLESAHGFEIFTSKGRTDSDTYATRILDSISLVYPDVNLRTDYGDGDSDKEENFYVLRNTRGPAVLIELGFISNPQEAKRLLDGIFLQDMTKVIAQAI